MRKIKDKENGQIFTPANIVSMMLDFGGYVDENRILKKHIIDNSCGDGAFLVQIVKRYCDAYIRHYNTDEGLVNDLEVYVHGVEVDENLHNKCIENLNKLLSDDNILSNPKINWDIKNEDALSVDDYDGKMDYVFGNPPYVRIHNIKGDDEKYEHLKSYSFSQNGNSDFYLSFYELGLRMKKDDGTLCYIAPSSWLTSKSGEGMRKYIHKTHCLLSVVDFKHTQVFENAQTYVLVTFFSGQNNEIIYNAFDTQDYKPVPVVTIPYDSIYINEKFYFETTATLNLLRNINASHPQKVMVKNGYATLNDDIFIHNIPPLSKYVIPVLKGSTGKWEKILFPYFKNEATGSPELLTLEAIKETAPDVYQYIVSNEEPLKNRTYDGKSTEKDYWWALGRSQGLNDTYKHKISISCIMKKPQDLKLIEVDSGCGIYSGMYILGDLTLPEIRNILYTDEFETYIKSLRKYKSGGYYTFSTKDLENYINYALNK